jgi:ABC-type sugar transport system ATPase subunit
VLLLDEPTKGIDVGTRQQIYQLMGRLADNGVSLVVVSSELDELLGLCDRFVVLADGQLVDEFDKGEGGETRILASIAGATHDILAGAE